jgi:protein-S-isoprenylcysteine O-methyltransferase
MLLRLGALALLMMFFALERVLRQPTAAAVQPAPSDRRSTGLLLAAYSLALVSLSVGQQLGPSLPPAVRVAGLGLGMLGLAVRAWAMRTLGASYTRTLIIATGQTVIQHGPYAWIRHPGYLASLLVWTGSAMAGGGSWLTLGVLLLLTLAYAYRIRAEEQMLVQAFGATYAQYQARTSRLLPFVV